MIFQILSALLVIHLGNVEELRSLTTGERLTVLIDLSFYFLVYIAILQSLDEGLQLS